MSSNIAQKYPQQPGFPLLTIWSPELSQETGILLYSYNTTLNIKAITESFVGGEDPQPLHAYHVDPFACLSCGPTKRGLLLAFPEH